MPREDRPVYCSDCFQVQRASRPPRRDDRSYSGSSNYGGGNRGGNRGGGGSRDGGGGGRDGGRDRRSRW